LKPRPLGTLADRFKVNVSKSIMPYLVVLLIGIFEGALPAQEDATQASLQRVAILVPVDSEYSWRDDAYLAAIPVASALGNGEPIVLSTDLAQPWRLELVDFLKRYAPDQIYWVSESPPPPCPLKSLPTLQHLPAKAATEAAIQVSKLVWNQSDRIVAYDPVDRSSAFIAATIAGRCAEPLIPLKGGVIPSPALESMGCNRLLWVGSGKAPKAKNVKVERISNGIAAVKWLIHHGYAVNYLAAVNAKQTVAGRNRHLALAAPLLAVARKGAVADLAYATQWKRRFDATVENGKSPKGAASSSSWSRSGTIELDSKSTDFTTGKDAAGKWWLQLDRNHDGRFSGKKEAPIRSGENFELGGLNWTADLDAQEKNEGKSIWITYPSTQVIQDDLGQYLQAAKQQPQYLCMVGWPDALPMAVIGDAQGIDADLVSDLPFSQTDDDPFCELAFARFIAEDLASATLLACRGFARDDFIDRGWEKNFATAEWETACRPSLVEAGLDFAGHHEGEEPFGENSPLANAGLIVHGSHAMWTVMGKTYYWNSPTIMAPAMVESAGCSTASLDQDSEHRSVAARLLRNGAVAFVGNTRRGVAQQDLFRSEFRNAILRGCTLGEAQRDALNRVMVAMLEKGQTQSGLYYYQYYNHAVYGDPALQLGLAEFQSKPVSLVEQKGSKVVVHAPKKWHRMEYTPLEEWGCVFPKLYTWRGSGVAVECSWNNAEKRNHDVLYINVEARTRRKVNYVKPMHDVPDGLGWTGTCFVDEHADGSRSLYWRVRMIDGDMPTGEIRAKVDELEFRLITRN
jgi:hypothetical protein